VQRAIYLKHLLDIGWHFEVVSHCPRDERILVCFHFFERFNDGDGNFSILGVFLSVVTDPAIEFIELFEAFVV